MKEALLSPLEDSHEVEIRSQEIIEKGEFIGERGVRFHVRYRLGDITGCVTSRKNLPSGATDIEEFQVDDKVEDPISGVDGEKYQSVHTHENPTGFAGSLPIKLVKV